MGDDQRLSAGLTGGGFELKSGQVGVVPTDHADFRIFQGESLNGDGPESSQPQFTVVSICATKRRHLFPLRQFPLRRVACLKSNGLCFSRRELAQPADFD